MPITKTNVGPPKRRGRPPGSTNRASQSSESAQTVVVSQPLSSQGVKRVENLQGIASIAVAISVFQKNYADAGAIALHSDKIAVAFARKAETSERFGKILDYMGFFGETSDVLTAMLPLLLQFAVNHKRIEADAVANFGVLPADLLEKRVKLEIKEQHARIAEQLAEQEAKLANTKVQTTVFMPPNGIGAVNASPAD